MKKKINKISLFIIISLLFVICSSVILQSGNKFFTTAQEPNYNLDVNDKIFDEENKNLAFVTGANEDVDGINQPLFDSVSSTYYIRVYIWVSSQNDTGKDIEIYYQTYGISAIASTGDYESKSGTVIVPDGFSDFKTTPIATIDIPVFATDFALQYERTYNDSKSMETYTEARKTRSFIFTLTGTNSKDWAVSPDKEYSQIENMIISDYSLPVTSWKYGKSQGINGKSLYTPQQFVLKEYTQTEILNPMDLYTFPESIYDAYRAYSYYNFKEESQYSPYAKIAKEAISLEFVPHGYNAGKYSVDVNGMWNMNMSLEEIDKSLHVKTDFDDTAENGLYGYSDGERVYGVTDTPATENYLSVFTVGYATVKNISLYKKWVDFTGPQVLEIIAQDTSTVTKDDPRWRLYVRFNEPVHFADANGPVTTNLPYLEASTGGESLTFYYAGGEWTDTLCFEADVSEYQRDNISKLYVERLANVKNICDFSYDHYVPGSQYGRGNEIYINTDRFYNNNTCKQIETQYVTFDPLFVAEPKVIGERIDKKGNNEFVSGVNATFDLDMGKGGTLQYRWTNSSDNTSDVWDATIKDLEDQAVIASGKLDGEIYLQVQLTSSYKRKSQIYTYGPYKFDTTSPTVNATLDSSSTLQQKIFNIDAVDVGITPSGLKNVYAVIVNQEPHSQVFENQENYKVVEIKNWQNGYTISASELGLVDGESKIYYIGFYAEDNLGHKSESNLALISYIKSRFDTREIFNSSLTNAYDKNKNDVTNLLVDCEDNYYIVDYSKIFRLHFERERVDSLIISINSFEKLNNGTWEAVSNENYLCLGYGEFAWRLELCEGIVSGLYRVSFNGDYNGGGIDTKSTENYYFYLTNNYQEETKNYINIKNGTTLLNQVYQFYAQASFYYMNDKGAVQADYYGDTALSATFSSVSIAEKYAYYYELQDLYAVIIGGDTASKLNQGTTGFIKSDFDEGRTATIGDIWIRYKRSSWNNNVEVNYWVYYYYGKTSQSPTTDVVTTIDINNLPTYLQESIDIVSKRIAQNGSTTFLIGEGNLDGDGMPYVHSSQLHNVAEITNVSKNGTTFEQDISFVGDSSIYSSKVELLDNRYDLATNFKFDFNEETQVWYRYDGSTEYHKLSVTNGFSLRNYVKTTGVYYIREVGEFGAREYPVYIDLTAPVVNIHYKDGRGENKIQISSGQELSVKQFIIELFDESECDKLSYVAVYRYRSSSLGLPTAVYTTAMLERESVILEDGKWVLKIGDRSGNYYFVTVNVSANPLICKVDITENEYFRISCNRTVDQIDRYEVFRNGTLITLSYSDNKKIVDAGNYRIYISDIYGNVYQHSFTFQRALPTIEWKYDVNGVPYEYNENSKHMIITPSAQNGYTYYIKTSVALRFNFTANYVFEFSGISEDLYTKTNYGARLKQPSSFTLKVWYADFENVYVIYYCTADTTSPSIDVTYDESHYFFAEQAELDAQAQDKENGDRLIPTTISYTKTSSTIAVRNNSSIFAQAIKATFSDDSGIRDIKVYLNGKRLENLIENNGSIILNSYGQYHIEVTDIFENLSVFDFTNEKTDYLSSLIDGYPYQNNQEVQFGKDNIEYKLNKNGDIYLLVDGTFIAIRIEDGNIYELYYKTVVASDGQTERKYAALQRAENPLFTCSGDDKIVDREYRLFSKDQLGVDVFVYFNVDYQITVRIVNAKEKDEITNITSRIYFNDYTEPVYTQVELSYRVPTLSFIGKDVEIGKQFDCNTSIEVDASSIDANVDSIVVYYAQPTKNYEFLSEIYSEGIYSGNIFTAEGLYKFLIRDKYGNETEYYFALFNSFTVTILANFLDGTQAIYLDKDIVYSNNYITFEALSDNVKVLVDGEEVATTTDSLGRTVFVLYGNRESVVTLIDKYGNQIVQQVKILNKTLTIQEDLMVGYPTIEESIKQEGFTNKKLSIVEEKLSLYGIAYIEVSFNDVSTILLDDIYNKIPLANLVECIGKNGDGIYKVTFRDVYGNKAVKTINYRESSALQITRTIRSSTEEEDYPISKMLLDNSVWSNNIVKLTTFAENYVLTINGVRENCPKTLSFNSSANTGSFSYQVYYADEYGFTYTFTINLFREVMDIKTVGANVVEIEGVLTTKDNIVLSYTDGAICSYILSDGQPRTYTTGTELKLDGTYKFTVIDKAGNIANLILRKDTLVEYDFVEVETAKQLINGEICSTNRVSFEPKEQGAYLKKVFLNGKLQNNYTDDKFNITGKWEVVVADAIGNESYFAFYILQKQISTFTYYAPYGYLITDVRLDEGDGIKNQVLDCIYNSGEYMVASRNGIYSVVMVSTITEDVINSSFTVNNSPPDVALVGCNEGEETLNNVSISGLKAGDIVYIYKDNKLAKTIQITALESDSPVITEGGNYKIVVENEAGVTKTLTFQKTYIPNIATSVLIIVVFVAIIIGLLIGLIWRNHSKTDK